MQDHKKQWVLVADGARGLIMRAVPAGDKVKLEVLRAYEQTNPPTREQGSDRPGRTNDAFGMHRSALPTTDWHQLAEDRFIAGIVDDLEVAARQEEFASLVIVAPPAALGTLRAAMPELVRSRVVRELHKDLTHLPVPEIASALAE